MLGNGPEKRYQRDGDERRGDGMGQEDGIVSMAHHETPAKIAFGHGSEDERKHDRRQGKAALDEQVAKNSRRKHHQDIEVIPVDGKRASA